MCMISYVIPCYGSEHTLESTVNEIRSIMKQHMNHTYEIILVNDSSPDNVWAVICNLARTDKRILGVCLSRNFGQHAAMLAGYARCRGDVVVSLDDDGQTPIDGVFQMIDKLAQYDVVFATYPKMKENAFRRFGSWVNNIMSEKLISKPKGLWATSFFAARKYVIDEIIKYRNSYPYVGGLIFQVTKNIGKVSLTQRERQQGKSGYTLKKLLSLWLNGFTEFSVKPLRIATFCGIGCSFLGVICAVVVVVRKLLNPDILLGYSSIMAALLFIGGMIMMLLGMIGEYVGRTYISVNNAPPYVVKEVVRQSEDQTDRDICKEDGDGIL